MVSLNPLLAQMETISYRFSRLGSFTEWWQWLVLAVVCAAIAAYVVSMYRRDSVELSRSLSIALMLLRIVALVGILFYYFKLERRADRELTKNSRALVLVDTSQSMSIRDNVTGVGSGITRFDEVLTTIQNTPLLSQLRDQHDLVVYRFDQDTRPVEVAAFPKTINPDLTPVDQNTGLSDALTQARRLAAIAALLAVVAIMAGVTHRMLPQSSRPEERTAWALLICLVCLIASTIVFATASLRDPRLPMESIVGLSSELPTVETPQAEQAMEIGEVNWQEQLRPRGLETRLGDAVRSLIAGERGGTAAGIVVFTDGNQNAGVEMSPVIATARDAAIPIHLVGLGSDVLPLNARVVDVEAPQRAYLGDKFTVTAHVMATGVAKGSLNLELSSAAIASKEGEQPLRVSEEERTIDVTEGELVSVRFEIEPSIDDVGKRQYTVRVKPINRETELDDNERSAKVEIVDRKDRILLIAGGPMREFIFLRNQLFRDEAHATHVTVLLQSARPGISQEASEIIYEFPKTADELFEYDCIVAFDPDWDALDELQIELLDRYVGEKAGGLIVVAGPVFTPQWTMRRDAGKLRTIKKLYPVHFYSPAAASLGLSRFGSASPWPIEFTREGAEAQFLWLGDDSVASRRAWGTFPGVFGYYAVKDPKPGATVYARFGDPDAKIDDEFPIYMAAHFYGSGRVFFLGSGEMWRTRSVDEALFEEFYTKLIRWAGEGRLLRDSNRGLLLVDKDRCFVGDRVAIRATLEDAQHTPLAVKEVAASLVTPKGLRVPLTLRKLQDSDREGIFTEQFTASQEGDYRIELAPPGGEEQLLVREVRTRIPDNELRDSRRNDALMADLAKRTGGTYFVGTRALASSTPGGSNLIDLLESKDQTTVLPGAPDKRFDERLMGWLIALVSGVLCLEWLLRRLNRLA